MLTYGIVVGILAIIIGIMVYMAVKEPKDSESEVN